MIWRKRSTAWQPADLVPRACVRDRGRPGIRLHMLLQALGGRRLQLGDQRLVVGAVGGVVVGPAQLRKPFERAAALAEDDVDRPQPPDPDRRP